MAASAVELVRPNGDTTQACTRSAGADNYALVDEQSLNSDSNTTYVYQTGLGSCTDYYDVPDPSVNSGTIDNVTVYVMARETVSDSDIYVGTRIKLGASTSNGSLRALTTSYVLYSDTFTTKPGGGSWTWTDIDNMEIGQLLSSVTGKAALGTQIYAVVNYTIPTGEELNPDGDTGTIDLTPSTAGDHYILVDETGTPDSSDYVYTFGSSTPTTDIYTISDSGIGAGTINGVTLVWRSVGQWFNNSGLGYTYPVMTTESTTYIGAEHDMFTVLHKNAGSYYSETWLLNPNTSLAWTWTQVDALQAGIVCKGVGGLSIVYAYQYYVIVDYTAAAATRRIIMVQ